MTAGSGGLGNQILRKCEVEVGNQHGGGPGRESCSRARARIVLTRPRWKSVSRPATKRKRRPMGRMDQPPSSSACRSTSGACRSRFSPASPSSSRCKYAQIGAHPGRPRHSPELCPDADRDVARASARPASDRRGGRRRAPRRQRWCRRLHAQRRSRRDRRQGARSGPAHPPARRRRTAEPARHGNPPSRCRTRPRRSKKRPTSRRNPRGRTNLTNGTRPAPARASRRARVPSL